MIDGSVRARSARSDVVSYGSPQSSSSAACVRRRLSSVYRSKGERQQIAAYYHSDFTVETGLDLLPTAASTREARFDRPSDATSGSKLHDPKKAGNGKKSLWRHPSIAYWF